MNAISTTPPDADTKPVRNPFKTVIFKIAKSEWAIWVWAWRYRQTNMLTFFRRALLYEVNEAVCDAEERGDPIPQGVIQDMEKLQEQDIFKT